MSGDRAHRLRRESGVAAPGVKTAALSTVGRRSPSAGRRSLFVASKPVGVKVIMRLLTGENDNGQAET